MNDTIPFSYQFVFTNGETQVFNLLLDSNTLELRPRHQDDPPTWALLERNQCTLCPLSSKDQLFCPVARNLSEVAKSFGDRLSCETVQVTVVTPERTYLKNTALQEGLSALLGVIMVTSGCPIMAPLKPMVRQHLPFATVPETVLRAVSMYLLAQYLRQRAGQTAEFTLTGLERIYARVAQVNRDFVHRLREAAPQDAHINALVGLDCFATMALLITDDVLERIKSYFSFYLEEAGLADSGRMA